MTNTRDAASNGRRRLPLRGADLVLMSMHARWRRTHPSHNTILVVDCDGPIPPARIQAALEKLLDVCPWPASRLRRPVPWGKLHWSAGPRASLSSPPVGCRSVASRGELHQALATELNASIDPTRQAPLRLVVIDHESEAGARQSVLVLTWFHPLMDPRGGERFLTNLALLDPEGGGAPGRDIPTGGEPKPDPRSLQERGRLARRNVAYMRSLDPGPLVSLGTGVASPGRVRFRQQRFRDPTPQWRLTPEFFWRLALVGKAMAELWTRRRLPDRPLLIPISVDLRPKGDGASPFGNCLAFHFARFQPSETADLPGLAQALRQQMVDALRDGQIDASAVAMEFLAYRPLSMMLRDLPWIVNGETFSFNCADIADFPSTPETLFGRGVLNAYHVPVVLPKPGLGVFFNRCRSANNIVVSWVDGVVDEDDVTRILQVVRDGMGWVEAP